MATLLIANDEPGLRETYGEVMARANLSLKIVQAESTEEAMRFVEELQDLIAALIDYHIPIRNGPPLIAFIRQKEAERRARRARLTLITSVSGKDFTQRRTEALEAGADAAIPFDPNTGVMQLRREAAEIRKLLGA